MDDEMKSGGDFVQSSQDAPKQGREMSAVRTCSRLFEQMVVFTVHQPHFEGHPGRIWTKRIVLALDIHDALALFFILAHHIAEDAALAFVVPLVGGLEFVLDTPGNENRGRDL